MTKIEAMELELAARKMVDGTGLDWVEVIRLKDDEKSVCSDLKLFIPDYIEFALGIIEGKPVWMGSEVFSPAGLKVLAGELPKSILIASYSWNPPKPKTVMVEMRVELVDYCSKLDVSMCPSVVEEVAGACRKALEALK